MFIPILNMSTIYTLIIYVPLLLSPSFSLVLTLSFAAPLYLRLRLLCLSSPSSTLQMAELVKFTHLAIFQ